MKIKTKFVVVLLCSLIVVQCTASNEKKDSGNADKVAAAVINNREMRQAHVQGNENLVYREKRQVISAISLGVSVFTNILNSITTKQARQESLENQETSLENQKEIKAEIKANQQEIMSDLNNLNTQMIGIANQVSDVQSKLDELQTMLSDLGTLSYVEADLSSLKNAAIYMKEITVDSKGIYGPSTVFGYGTIDDRIVNIQRALTNFNRHMTTGEPFFDQKNLVEWYLLKTESVEQSKVFREAMIGYQGIGYFFEMFLIFASCQESNTGKSAGYCNAQEQKATASIATRMTNLLNAQDKDVSPKFGGAGVIVNNHPNYEYVTSKKTRQEAEEHCKSSSGHLASFISLQEFETVFIEIKKQMDMENKIVQVFIGGTCIRTIGYFPEDGARKTYPDEPDNSPREFFKCTWTDGSAFDKTMFGNDHKPNWARNHPQDYFDSPLYGMRWYDWIAGIEMKDFKVPFVSVPLLSAVQDYAHASNGASIVAGNCADYDRNIDPDHDYDTISKICNTLIRRTEARLFWISNADIFDQKEKFPSICKF